MRIFAISLIILLSSRGEATTCHSPVEYICRSPNPNPEFYVPGNIFELKEYCSTTKEFLECLHTFDLACKGRSKFMGLYPPFYYHRIRNVLDKVCDKEGTYYDVLALNLPCINQRITAMDDVCSRSNKRVQKAYDEYLLKNPNRKIKNTSLRNLRTQCLAYVATTACVIRNIQHECGFSASEISSEYILETQILAKMCEIDIFLEVKEAVNHLSLEKSLKDDLKKYFVVEIL